MKKGAGLFRKEANYGKYRIVAKRKSRCTAGTYGIRKGHCQLSKADFTGKADDRTGAEGAGTSQANAVLV